MMNKEFRIEKYMPFWNALPDEHKKLIGESVIFRSYKPGENILINSSHKDGMIFICRGRMRVYLASDSGRELTLISLGEGGAFNVMTVDEAGERDVVPFLQADGELTIAYLNQEALAVTAYAVPEVARFIYKTAAHIAQTVLNTTSFCFFNTLRSCIAQVILRESDRCKPSASCIKITHEEIANNLGTTRVVTSRELDLLRSMNLISTGRGKITILDRHGLESIAFN